MKIEYDLKYFGHIGMVNMKSTYSYRILNLLLTKKTYTLTQLANILGVTIHTLYRPVRELEYHGLIEIEKIEGNNKFYKAMTNISRLDVLIPGQTKMNI